MKAEDINWRTICTLAFEEAERSKIAMLRDVTFNNDYYKWIPLDDGRLSHIVKHILTNVRNTSKKKFLDIGCGVPVVPNVMQSVFKRADGLEYNDIYCKLEPSLIKGDLLTFDKYKEYDVLYAYNPIRCQKLMTEGLKHIIKSMKRNSVFYYVNAIVNNLEDLGFESINGSIYVYKKK